MAPPGAQPGGSKYSGSMRLIALALLSLLLLPINDSRPQTAPAAYDQALKLFQRGDLVGSQQIASLGLQRFQSSNPAWAMKLKLVLAKSMLYRGMYDDALKLLSPENEPPNPEDAIQELTIEAVALTRQQKLPAAQQRLSQAQAICNKADFASCGELDTARAIFRIRQGLIA